MALKSKSALTFAEKFHLENQTTGLECLFVFGCESCQSFYRRYILQATTDPVGGAS